MWFEPAGDDDGPVERRRYLPREVFFGRFGGAGGFFSVWASDFGRFFPATSGPSRLFRSKVLGRLGGAPPGPSLRASDPRDASRRREDAGVPVLPPDADTRRLFAEHLLDHSYTARL